MRIDQSILTILIICVSGCLAFACISGCSTSSPTTIRTPQPKIPSIRPGEPDKSHQSATDQKRKTKPHPSFRDCTQEIAITEIMFNPDAAEDRYGEYIELFNFSSASVQLEGWQLTNGRGDLIRFPQAMKIPPRTAIILGGSEQLDLNGEIPIDFEWSNFSLANKGGLLHLRNPCSESVDRIRYGVRYPWPKQKAGASLERVTRTVSDLKPYLAWKVSRSPMVTGDQGTPKRILGTLSKERTLKPRKKGKERVKPLSGKDPTPKVKRGPS